VLQSEAASRVQSNLASAGAAFFTADNVSEAIQDGYDESISLLTPLAGSSVVTLSDNLVYYDFYNSLASYLYVLAIYNNTTKRWLDYRSIKWLEDQRRDWELTEGQPSVFTLLDYKYVGLWPTLTTATGTLDVFYKKKGKQLVAADTIDVLDLEPDLVEWYATADCLEQIEEVEKAQYYWDKYVAAVKTGQKLMLARAGKDLAYQLAQKI